jgi:antitoxin YefM
MITVTLSKFKKNPEVILNQSRKNREPILVETRPDGFVVLRQDEYNSLIETLHLLRNEANAKWLKESIQQADRGQLIPFEQVNERFGADTQRA